MLSTSNPAIFTKANSVYMKPIVSAEWNHNLVNPPYFTVAGDGQKQVVQKTGGLSITNSNIVKPGFTTKKATYNGGSSYDTGSLIYSVPTTSGDQAYKVVFFMRTNSEPINQVRVNTKISSNNLNDHGSSSFEIDSISWTKIETYIGSDDIINNLSIEISIFEENTNEGANPFDIYFTEPEVCATTLYDYKYGSMFSSDSPFKYFRPGESYVKTGNTNIPLPNKNTYRQIKTLGSSWYMPLSPLVYSTDFAFLQNPSLGLIKNGLPTNLMPFQYFVSDQDVKKITAYYDKSLITNKIVIKFNTQLTIPNSLSIKVNGILVNFSTPLTSADWERGVLTLYWDGTKWTKNEWSIMPKFNSDGSLSTYTEVNSISLETTESLREYIDNTKYDNINSYVDRMQLIEVSPRLEIDLSDFVETTSIDKTLDSESSQLPISSINSNTASISLSGIPALSSSNQAVSIFSNQSNDGNTILSNLLYKNVKFYVNFKTESAFAENKDPNTYSSYNQYIPGGVFYTDSWEEKDIDSISVQLYDVSRYLQSVPAPDYVANLKTIFDIITNVFDLIGFTDYDYDSLYEACNAAGSPMEVSYYYCSSKDKTILQAISELLSSYQIGSFIDEYGIIKFISLSKILSSDISNQNINKNIIVIDDFNIEQNGYSTSNKTTPGKVSLTYNPPKIKQSPSLQNIKNIDIKNASSFAMTTSNDIVWSQTNMDSVGFNFIKESLQKEDSTLTLDVKDLLDIFHTYSFNANGFAAIENEIISFENKEYFISSGETKNLSGFPYTRTVSVKNEIELSSQINDFVRKKGIGFVKESTKNSTTTITPSLGIKTFFTSNTDGNIDGFYKYGRVHIYDRTSPKTKYIYGYITEVTQQYGTSSIIKVRPDNFSGTSGSDWVIANIPDYDVYVEPTGRIRDLKRGLFNTEISSHILLPDGGIENLLLKNLSASNLSTIYETSNTNVPAVVLTNKILVSPEDGSKTLIYPKNQYDQGYSTYSTKIELPDEDISAGGIFFNMPVNNGNIYSDASAAYFVELVKALNYDDNTIPYKYFIMVYQIDQDLKPDIVAYAEVTQNAKYIIDNLPKVFVENPDVTKDKYLADYDEIFNIRIVRNIETVDQGNVSIDGNETLSVFLNNITISGWQVAGRYSEDVSYTSSSSVSITPGYKTFEITGTTKYIDPTNLPYGKNQYIYAVADNMTDYIFGKITEVDTTTTPGSSLVTIILNEFKGSGTYTSWSIYDDWIPVETNPITGLKKKVTIPDTLNTNNTIFGSYISNKPVRWASYITIVPVEPPSITGKILEIYATQTPLLDSSSSYFYNSKTFLNQAMLNQRSTEKTYCMQTKPEVVGINYYDVEYKNPAAVITDVWPIEYLWYYLPTSAPADQKYRQRLYVNKYNLAYSTVLNTGFKGKFMIANNSPHLIFTNREADAVNDFSTVLNLWTHQIIAPSDSLNIEKVVNQSNISEVIQINSEWIQSESAAQKILNTIAKGSQSFSKEISLNIFGNPVIQVGDIVNLSYSLKGIVNKNYFIKNVSHSFDSGLSTTITMVELESQNIYSLYKINYDEQGGATVLDKVYVAGSSIGSLPSTSRADYDFVGWFTAPTGGTQVSSSYTPASPYGDITLYARWKRNIVNVTYNGNGNTTGPTQSNVKLPLSNLNYFILDNQPSITKAGYSFASWNTKSDGTGTTYYLGQEYLFEEDLVLYAIWTINSYTISYDGNDNTSGTAPSSVTQNYDTKFTVSGPNTLVRTGYTFVGWNTAANGTGTSYVAGSKYTIGDSDAMLYAQWSFNDFFTVTYHGNGNTSGTEPSPQTGVPYSEITIKDIGSLVKDGYTFSGYWSEDPEGVSSSYSVGENIFIGSDSIDLYALWSFGSLGLPNEYNYTFETENNFGPIEQSFDFLRWSEYDWTSPYGPILEYDTAIVHSGSKSMKITWNDLQQNPQVSSVLKCVPNTIDLIDSITISAWVYVPSGSPDILLNAWVGQYGLSMDPPYVSAYSKTSVKDQWVNLTLNIPANDLVNLVPYYYEHINIEPDYSNLSAGTAYIDDITITVNMI